MDKYDSLIALIRGDSTDLETARELIKEEIRVAMKTGAEMRQKLIERALFGGMVSGGDMPLLGDQPGDWKDVVALAHKVEEKVIKRCRIGKEVR